MDQRNRCEVLSTAELATAMGEEVLELERDVAVDNQYSTEQCSQYQSPNQATRETYGLRFSSETHRDGQNVVLVVRALDQVRVLQLVHPTVSIHLVIIVHNASWRKIEALDLNRNAANLLVDDVELKERSGSGLSRFWCEMKLLEIYPCSWLPKWFLQVELFQTVHQGVVIGSWHLHWNVGQ